MAQLVLQPDGSTGVDTHIYSIISDGNFGWDTILRAGTDYWGKGALTFSRVLLRFNLAALPAGATVATAALTLYHGNGALSSGATFFLYRVTQTAWTEFGATWTYYDGANAWVEPGGDYTTTGGTEATLDEPSQDLVFTPLTNLVDDAIVHRAGLLHVLVIGPESGSDDNFFEAKSSDDSTAATRPKLVVDYVPAPVLSIADHADGTGATATISGADAGSTNIVLVQGFSGDLGSGAWQSAGIVAGNDDVDLDLPPGHYFAYAASSLGGVVAVSSVVYFVVTDGLESLHTRCLTAAQARIQSLAMAGLAGDSVVVRKLPVDRHLGASGGIALPAVVLSPRRAAMPPSAGTNGFDDVHYDVLVTIFDRDNQEPTLQLNLGRHLLWREQIARAFRNQRLGGVPEVINAEVEPAEGLLEEAWKHELMVSALLLRFTSRETRGF